MNYDQHDIFFNVDTSSVTELDRFLSFLTQHEFVYNGVVQKPFVLNEKSYLPTDQFRQ